MSLSTLVSLLSAAPQILALVDQAVVSVENTLNVGFSSSQKLAAAEAKVNGWLATAQADLAQFGELSSVVTGLINTAVAAFNAAGAFNHKPATAPAA